MSKVLVIGGGPAGMLASYMAAEKGHRVTLIEKNEKLGKKLFITGKGRCNVTNAGDMEQLFANVMSNRKFLYSAFYACTNEWVMDFIESYGTPLKVERGNRVFPVSDRSSDIIQALKKALKDKNVNVLLKTRVEKLIIEEHAVQGVQISDGSKIKGDHVIIATGGLSYPSTGSTGDGYRFAAESGHRLIPRSPALVPMNCRENWVQELQGLSLKNTSIQILDGKKQLYQDFGEMLFTHFGVSGPMILSATAAMKPSCFEKELKLVIDLKPALEEEQLDKRMLREFQEAQNKAFKNAVHHLFPGKLIPVMIALSGIDPDKRVNEISREERKSFVHLIKNLEISVSGLRDFQEAIITKGGISVKDVDPSTMKSKMISGLSFCGEVLDLDAMTGGYNLQIAWSTGYLAGISIE